MNLYITEDYHTVVGDDEEGSLYHVVNTNTEVVEYKDNILPRTIDTMVEMQSRLVEARARLNGDKPKLAVVKGEGDEGGNGLH